MAQFDFIETGKIICFRLKSHMRRARPDWSDRSRSLQLDFQTSLNDRIAELNRKPKETTTVDRWIELFEECGGGQP
jgi:hypothetical protein